MMKATGLAVGIAALALMSAPAFSMCCGAMGAAGKDGAKMQCGAKMQHADASKAAVPGQSTAKDQSTPGHESMKHDAPAADGKASAAGCCCCGEKT